MMTRNRLKFGMWLTAGLSAALVVAQDLADPWERMRQNDANRDGKISRQEFRGPAMVFDRADANGDGFITPEEMRAMRRPFEPGARPGGPGLDGPASLMQRFDTNADGKVSLDEWEKFFKDADKNGDEILETEEWRAALRGESVRDPAPQVGDPAPPVKAESLASGALVDLAKPKRTMVLIFGSHT